jgi:hypothetical protein
MDDLTSSLAAETDALRETYAALNRNDIEAAVKAFDPRIAWIEPTEYPGGGTYHGHGRLSNGPGSKAQMRTDSLPSEPHLRTGSMSRGVKRGVQRQPRGVAYGAGVFQPDAGPRRRPPL